MLKTKINNNYSPCIIKYFKNIVCSVNRAIPLDNQRIVCYNIYNPF